MYFKVTAEGLRPDPEPHPAEELSTLVLVSPLTVREGDQEYKFLLDHHVGGTTYAAGDTFSSADDKLAFELIAAGVLEIVEATPARSRRHDKAEEPRHGQDRR